MKANKKNAVKAASNKQSMRDINLASNLQVVATSQGATSKPRTSSADQISINEWIYGHDYTVSNYIDWVKSHYNEIPYEESVLRSALAAVPGMSADAINRACEAAKRASLASVPTLEDVYNVMNARSLYFRRVYGCNLPKLEDVKLYSRTGVPMASVTCTSKYSDYVMVSPCPVSYPSISSIVRCISSVSIDKEYWAAYGRVRAIAYRDIDDDFERGVRAALRLGWSVEDVTERVQRIIDNIQVADPKSYTRLTISLNQLLDDVYKMDRDLTKLVGWDGAVTRPAAYCKLSSKRADLHKKISIISDLLGL